MVDVSGKDVTARDGRARPAASSPRRRSSPCCAATACRRATRWPWPASPASPRAKRTPDLVPLCHPVALHGVQVDLDLTDDAVEIIATTRTADRTGVEMEALTSVVAAGLALYDMVKAVDRGARLTDVRLLAKAGGRSRRPGRRTEPA